MKLMRDTIGWFLFLFCISGELFSAPVVTGVSPNFGPTAGGTSVTISGSGFTGATNVSVGGQSVAFLVVNDSTITFTSPNEAPSSVDIIVTAGTPSPVTQNDQFTFQGNWFLYATSNSAQGVVPVDLAATPVVGSTISTASANIGRITINQDRTFAYVADSSTDSVSVIDLLTNTVVDTVALPASSFPIGIAISPDGSTVYVTTTANNRLYSIDTSTNTIITSVATGTGPLDVAVTPDGQFVYTANSGGHSLSYVDAALSLAPTTINIPAGMNPNPYGLAITPDGSYVYVSNANSSSSNYIVVVDTSTNTVNVSKSMLVTDDAYNIVISPDGRFAYAPQPFGLQMLKIDISTNAVTPIAFPGGNGPYGVAITSDSNTAYVTSAGGANIIPVDLTTDTLGTPISLVGRAPFFIAITPDQAPAAQFVATPLLGGGAASFNASNSRASVGTLTYNWDFGDGTGIFSVSTPITSHIYTVQGTYNVTLEVVDSGATGIEDTFTGRYMSNNGSLISRSILPITINTSPLPPDSTVNPPSNFKGKISTSGRLKLKMQWQASTSDNIVSYQIYKAGKRMVTISSSGLLKFKKNLHPIKFYKEHLNKYAKFLNHRYKIRAVNASGEKSAFVQLKTKS